MLTISIQVKSRLQHFEDLERFAGQFFRGKSRSGDVTALSLSLSISFNITAFCNMIYYSYHVE